MGSRARQDTGAISRTIEDIRNHFEYLSGIGCPGFNCSPQSLEMLQTWGQKKKAQDNQDQSLETIQTRIGACHRCSLSHTPGKPFAGQGNPNARLLFVGDAPTAGQSQADSQTQDPADGLLTKIIQAMHLTRESVYITSIVKCPAPDGRPPLPEETAACLPFLMQQIHAIHPELVVTLGPSAAGSLLNTPKPLSQLRSRFHPFEGIRVMPTHHPEDLLKHPEKKRDVWEDMKQVMRALNL